MAIHGQSSSRAFLLGLVTGIVYFTGTLYWLATVMSLHGGLARWVAVLINAGASAVNINNWQFQVRIR